MTVLGGGGGEDWSERTGKAEVVWPKKLERRGGMGRAVVKSPSPLAHLPLLARTAPIPDNQWSSNLVALGCPTSFLALIQFRSVHL